MDSWEFGVQIRKSAKEQGLSCCYGCYHCYSFLPLSAKFLFFCILKAVTGEAASQFQSLEYFQ